MFDNRLFLVVQVKPIVDDNALLYRYMNTMFSDNFMKHHVNQENDNSALNISEGRYNKDPTLTKNTVIRVYKMIDASKKKNFSVQISRVHQKIHCNKTGTCKPKEGKIHLKFNSGVVRMYYLDSGTNTDNYNVVEVHWDNEKKFYHLHQTLSSGSDSLALSI